MTLRVKGKVWKYREPGGWYFLTISKRTSTRIKALMKSRLRGFGSIRTTAQIGRTKWKTSIFPTRSGTYVLPIKSSVRQKQAIADGDLVAVRLELS